MMEELSPLAKDLLFEMVYHGTIKQKDIPEKYKEEYTEWENKYYQTDEYDNIVKKDD